MDSRRKFDRARFGVPLVRKDVVLPPVEEATLRNSLVEARSTDHLYGNRLCIAYCRYYNALPYIDVYFVDHLLDLKHYKRFTIIKGYCFDEKEEEQFVHYCESEKSGYSPSIMEALVKKVNEEFPEIHLIRYEEMSHILLHLYFSLHRSGAREILYKSNLNYIGAALDGMKYECIGSSPEKIFKMPLRMLRSLNHSGGIEILKDDDVRESAYEIYGKFHNYIRSGFSNTQWFYIYDCFFDKEEIDKEKFRFLGKIWDEDTYLFYRIYWAERERVKKHFRVNLKKIPKNKDGSFLLCSELTKCIGWEADIEAALKNKSHVTLEEYGYETEKFYVDVPSDFGEFIKVIEKQHNCLAKYIFQVALGDIILLFVREKKNPDKIAFVMEIQEKAVKQAFQAFNRALTKEQEQFLRDFAEEKYLGDKRL